MRYGAAAYREFSEMLTSVLNEIDLDEEIGDDEVIVQREGVARVIEKIAEIFEASHPRGFDKDRFFDDVYGPEK